jgi:TRAP-type mannitol/chloroaromatic compound transport system substrate-binding protein
VLIDKALNQFAKETHKYIEELKKKYPDVKKVMDSQEKFRKDFAQWRDLRGGLAPWPYKEYVNGRHSQ